MKRFLKAVRAEARAAVKEHGDFNSVHEAYGVLKEEVDEFWDEVKKKRRDRNLQAMISELTQIAAVCAKAAKMIKKTMGPF